MVNIAVKLVRAACVGIHLVSATRKLLLLLLLGEEWESIVKNLRFEPVVREIVFSCTAHKTYARETVSR